MTLNTQTEAIQEVHEKLNEQFLIDLGQHIDAYYVKNYNPKFPKASLPQNQEMTLLLENIRQTNDINARNKNEHTLLSLVAYTNERELLELLLSHPKIDVNTQNKQKNTPLMMVILKGRNMVPMLKPLLDRSDIDLEIRNNYENDGATALMTAERHLEFEQDESQKYHYVEAIELLKAKQAELTEKPKTLEGIINTTKNLSAHLIEEIPYIVLNDIALERNNHGIPQCPEISLNTRKFSSTEPQAWNEEIDGIEHWYYNYPGALAEAKYLGKIIPTDDQWSDMLGNIYHEYGDEIAKRLDITLTGHLDPTTNQFSDVGYRAEFWSSSPWTYRDTFGAVLEGNRRGSDKRIFRNGCGLSLRFLYPQVKKDDVGEK